MSSDVLQALYDAMPPPWPQPNPKDGNTGELRLFGDLVDVDARLPPNSMLLERVTTSVTVNDPPETEPPA